MSLDAAALSLEASHMPNEASYLLGTGWISDLCNFIPLHVGIYHGVADGTLPPQHRIDTVVNGLGDALISIRVSIDSELSPPVNILGCDILKFILEN